MKKIAPQHEGGMLRTDAGAVVDNRFTVWAVLLEILRHPVQRIGRQWNWKSALLSSLLRGAIFFFVNLGAGLHAALGAMLAELALRAVLSGFCGALTQAFRHATPRWAATTTVMVLLPFANHSLELVMHWLRHTPELKASIIASVTFTAISSAFNLYAMRRGVLVVGRERKSLRHDLAHLPRLLVGFLYSILRTAWRTASRRFRPLSLRTLVPRSSSHGWLRG